MTPSAANTVSTDIRSTFQAAATIAVRPGGIAWAR